MSIASNFRLLKTETLSKIHQASLDILANTGVVFQSTECLDIFKNHGAMVEGQIVFIPEQMVEKAVKSSPETFQWEALNPDRSINVGKGQEGIHVSMNNDPIYIQDFDTELYGIPTRCMAGLTDSKIIDCQAGFETMQNYLMLAMSGVNIVNECFGILDAIMTVSYEKFIIDEEIMSRSACVVKGIDSFEDDFSKNIIKEVGHGGSYFMHPSTLKYCRSFWEPLVSDTKNFDDWKKNGEQDIKQKANKIFKEILKNCPDIIIDQEVRIDLEKYVKHVKEKV